MVVAVLGCVALGCVPVPTTPAPSTSAPPTTSSLPPDPPAVVGDVTTFAGYPGECDVIDGDGSTARLGSPYTVAVDESGWLYVIESWHGVIRRVAPDGSVETVAGALDEPGLVDGIGADARIGFPGLGTDTDAFGRLLFVDVGRQVVRQLSPDGEVDTVAGVPAGPGVELDPDRWTGPASNTQFISLEAVAVDGDALVVSDFASGTVRRVEDGEVSILWSDGSHPEIGRIGSGTFDSPMLFVVPDADGDLWVADWGSAVGRLTRNAEVSVLAGSPGALPGASVDGTGPDARFVEIGAGAVGSDGLFYVPGDHVVRRIDPDGRVTTIAGAPGQAGYADGTGAAARFDTVSALAFGPDGALYASDSRNCVIRRIT